VLIVIIVIITVVIQSQPQELAEKATPGEDKIYVNAADVLLAVAIIGIGAIAFAALASWFVARGAVRPLGEALRRQRAFVADASHELRTPLAVLDARLQLLQHRLTSNDPNTETVAELRADAQSLIGIVNELLVAAGGHHDGAADEVTEAARAVAATVADLRLLTAQRGITITFEAHGQLPVRIPASSLRRCVSALVDNALSYTRDGGAVEVALVSRSDRRTVALTVTDHGPGIRGIDPARIFDRFAHSDPAADDVDRSLPPRRGFGIGLSLVRDVAARSGGDVRVERTGPDGTVIALELIRA